MNTVLTVDLQKENLDLKIQLQELQLQVDSLKSKNMWGNNIFHGKITKIREGNGKLYIITLNDGFNYHNIQCWSRAYEQLLTNQFKVGDVVSCFAWPSYYKNNKDKQCISFKTDVLSLKPSLANLNGFINSEWLKTTSAGKDIWQFTLRDFNNNGNVVHCRLPKTDWMMRYVVKGLPVSIIGNEKIEVQEDGTMRRIIDVLCITPLGESK